MRNVIVLYHENCLDGFASALAYKKFQIEEENTIYLYVGYPVDWNYLMSSIENIKIKNTIPIEIVMLDYAMPKERLITLCQEVDWVTVIDHHKGMQQELLDAKLVIGNLTVDFDLDHSGCVLTWNHYCKDFFAPPPEFLLHVEDRDLWKFELSNTEAVCLGAQSFEMDLEDCKHWLLDTSINDLADIGNSIIKYRNTLIDNSLMRIYVGTILDYNAIFINVEPQITSETGAAILKKVRGCNLVVLYHIHDRRVIYSLRSDGTVDCIAIAKHFGGGGHPKAAGFSVSLTDSHLFKGELK